MTGPNPPQGPYGPPPPHGQPAPPPSGYPPAPVGKPPRMSTRKKLGVIGIAVGVVAVGIVASLIFTRKEDVSNAGVGDCVRINKSSETDADVDKIDCADGAASLKVAKRYDSNDAECPTIDYLGPIRKRGGGGPDFTLCLIPNAKEGDCFAGLLSESPEGKPVRADCAAGAEFKFVKVIDGTADEAACDAETFPLVYPEPPTTFCLAAQP